MWGNVWKTITDLVGDIIGGKEQELLSEIPSAKILAGVDGVMNVVNVMPWYHSDPAAWMASICTVLGITIPPSIPACLTLGAAASYKCHQLECYLTRM